MTTTTSLNIRIDRLQTGSLAQYVTIPEVAGEPAEATATRALEAAEELQPNLCAQCGGGGGRGGWGEPYSLELDQPIGRVIRIVVEGETEQQLPVPSGERE